MSNLNYPFTCITNFITTNFKQIFTTLFFAFTFSHSAFSNGTNWAIGLEVRATPVANSLCSTISSNCYKLEVNNIPDNINPAGDKNGYSCFWFFGDGLYDMTEIPPDDNSTYIYHEFRVSVPNGLYLQLAKRYDDKDDPVQLLLSPSTPINEANPRVYDAPPLDKNGSTGDILITPSLSPRTGDKATYVISFQFPTICETINTPYDIEFKYNDPNNIIDINMTDTPNRTPVFFNDDGTLYTPTNLNIDNTTKTLTFSYPPLQAISKTIHAFIELEFINAPDGINAHFDAAISAPPSTGCFSGTINGDLDVLSVKSHDPNKMISNRNDLCPDDTGTIEYTIIFQNIGSGPANKVYVRYQVPEYFLFNQTDIATLGPTGLNYEVPLNTSTKELEWILSTNNTLLKNEYPNKELKGTEQNGYKKGSAREHYTMDSIRFSVKINPNVPLPPCGAIPNRAKIYFDNNTPIITEDFYTRINCTGCNPCTSSAEGTTLPPTFLNSASPVPISLPSPSDELSSIYPSVKITDKKVGSAAAMFTETGTYTIVSTSNCTRNISEITIRDTIIPSHITEDCNWWTCELTIGETNDKATESYIWKYQKDNEWFTTNGNSLNFTGIQQASVLINQLNGSPFLYTPCVFCWKNFLLKYWWCTLGIILFLCFIFYRIIFKR